MATSTCPGGLAEAEAEASPPSSAHDPLTNDLGETIYNLLPSRTLNLDLSLPTHDLRSASIATKRHYDAQYSRTSKRKTGPPGLWTAPKGGKRTRLDSQNELRMELHQSTCLSLNDCATSNESDLWILPSLEEWELEASTTNITTTTNLPNQERSESEWAPLVSRAVHSNRERLRRRLEGDGWDFIGGKYGEDVYMKEEYAQSEVKSEENVDEEFDVVVLPMIAVS